MKKLWRCLDCKVKTEQKTRPRRKCTCGGNRGWEQTAYNGQEASGKLASYFQLGR